MNKNAWKEYIAFRISTDIYLRLLGLVYDHTLIMSEMGEFDKKFIYNMRKCMGKLGNRVKQKINKCEKEFMAKNFIQEAIKKPGALRKSLGVKKGEKIPEAKLEKAEHSKNPKTKKRAVLAETLKKLRK